MGLKSGEYGDKQITLAPQASIDSDKYVVKPNYSN
jgi:hypothetical protein